MFNLQGSELIIILLLALVVLGPEKLPDAMRRAGKFYAELRKMSTGFQEEFRAAVDEPMREIRDTANVLRDSADFTRLQEGEREEKPKSAEMAPVDPDAVPSDETPSFDSGPTTAADSKPAPFSGESSAAPRTESVADDAPGRRPTPFGGESSAAPRRPGPAPTPITAPAPFTGMSAPKASGASDIEDETVASVADDAADEAADSDDTQQSEHSEPNT